MHNGYRMSEMVFLYITNQNDHQFLESFLCENSKAYRCNFTAINHISCTHFFKQVVGNRCSANLVL